MTVDEDLDMTSEAKKDLFVLCLWNWLATGYMANVLFLLFMDLIRCDLLSERQLLDLLRW